MNGIHRTFIQREDLRGKRSQVLIFIGSHPVPQPAAHLSAPRLHHGRSRFRQPIVDRLIAHRHRWQRADPKTTDASPQIPLRDPSVQQTPHDTCRQQLGAQAGWPSTRFHHRGCCRLRDGLHQQGFHQRHRALQPWQFSLSRGIIHQWDSFFSLNSAFEKDCPLFCLAWQPPF